MAEAFDDELQAAMVVVAAAAFAIDALYVKLDDLLDPSIRASGDTRVGRIVRTFEVALELGRRTQTWQAEIPRLFKRRGELVHFRGVNLESQPHPTGKSHVSRENALYTAEQAARAVDLALEVLTVAYSSPRKKHGALVDWSERATHVPAWLGDLRRGT